MSAETPRDTFCSVALALESGARLLRSAGIDGARLDARLLLAHALGRSQASLVADLDALVEPTAYHALLARRAAREPVALILGRREFWSLDLRVTPATLVPRADSEAVVAAALESVGPAIGLVLDLGTGTGALLLAVLSERVGAWGLGLDRSPEAALVARANARALGLADRAAFAVADWAAPLAAGRRFDRVLCNPPYIPSAEIPGLMPEVAQYEPRDALDGGNDGLDAYRAVVPTLPGLLAVGGRAVLEVGQHQAAAVAGIAAATGLAVGTRRDLAGIERVVVAEKTIGTARPVA